MRNLCIGAVIIFAALSWNSGEAQQSKDKIFEAYARLVGAWETQGKWETGVAFHQRVEVALELSKNVFTVKTYDYIDSEQFENSQRNYGVRVWDEQQQKMMFWEFDVFGGITSGEIIVDSKDIYHVYSYRMKDGEQKLMADAWVFVDDDTYRFNVCEFSNGKPGKVFLSSVYTRK